MERDETDREVTEARAEGLPVSDADRTYYGTTEMENSTILKMEQRQMALCCWQSGIRSGSRSTAHPKELLTFDPPSTDPYRLI